MDKRLRSYTGMRLKKNNFNNFFRRFSITTWLIIVNVVIFIIVSLVFAPIFGDDKISYWLALQANGFFSGRVWTLFTSMFMHANIGHLLANMISLFFIGSFVERLIGRKRFFWFYMIGGLFAGLFFVFLSYFFGNFTVSFGSIAFNLGDKLFTNPLTYAVGASGAIFALAGLLAVLTPYNKVYLIAGPLIAIVLEAIFINIFPSSSFIGGLDLLINVYFIVSILLMFSFNSNLRKIALPISMSFWLLPIVAIVPLIIIGLFVPLPIGNTAHLGGLILGLAYGVYLRKKYKKKTTLIRNYFK